MQQSAMSELPEEYRQRIQMALLQQQMAQQAQAQASQPMETLRTARGTVVKRNPLEYAARLGAQGIAAWRQRQAMEQASQARGEAAALEQSERSAVTDALVGRGPEELAGPMPDGTSPLMSNPIKPSVTDAIARASKSPVPGVRAFGADLQRRQMDRMDKVGEKLVGGATTPTAVQYGQTGDLGVLRPQPKVMESGGAIVGVNPDSGAVAPMTPGRYTPGTMTVAGMTIPSNKDTYTGKETPTAGVSMTTNPGVKSQERVSGARLDNLQKNKPLAQAAADELGTLYTLSQRVAQGYTSGSMADWRVELAKAGKLLGFPEDPKAINAEVVKSLLGERILDRAKALGANPSNADATRIEQIVGRINTDPKALVDLLREAYMLSARGLARYNGEVQRSEDAEKRLDPGADFSPFLVYPNKDIEDPSAYFSGLAGQVGKPAAPAPGQPKPATRRRIDLLGGM